MSKSTSIESKERNTPSPPELKEYTLRSVRGPYTGGAMGVLYHYTRDSLTKVEGNTKSEASSILVKMPKYVPLTLIEEEIFNNEIKLGVKLDKYKYFPKIIGSESSPVPYIIMKAEEGYNLKTLIDHVTKRGKIIPLRYIKYMMSQLSNAVELIHEEGYLDNDLKPE
ncbi:MAG: hypothetical protein Q8N63_05330, partial [Nanoarchaeota archaeon]|nr:hypothetical protein [Nanoarchaeota archaeon]